MSLSDSNYAFFSRIIGVIAASTVVLTASFIGVVAVLDGETAGIGSRAPFYVLGMAIAFVIALFNLDDTRADGREVFLATLGIALFAFVIISLGGEGLLYLLEKPENFFASHVIVYFLAAGLLCTGIGYWGLRHWKEFSRSRRSM